MTARLNHFVALETAMTIKLNLNLNLNLNMFDSLPQTAVEASADLYI